MSWGSSVSNLVNFGPKSTEKWFVKVDYFWPSQLLTPFLNFPIVQWITNEQMLQIVRNRSTTLQGKLCTRSYLLWQRWFYDDEGDVTLDADEFWAVAFLLGSKKWGKFFERECLILGCSFYPIYIFLWQMASKGWANFSRSVKMSAERKSALNVWSNTLFWTSRYTIIAK